MYKRDLFSWSIFVIYIYKNVIKYKFLIFAGYSLHLDNVKKALLQFQIHLEILGRVEIYLITNISRFPLRKMTFAPFLLYQPVYPINPHKKARITKLKFPFVVDKTFKFLKLELEFTSI